jgi:crotonobetainyl-CoA:carnitine CoA-transferase CaiB-like acyl-CoA transferase
MNSPVLPTRPFEGLRVADLSDSIAGQFAARLLADHGADVTAFHDETSAGPDTPARQRAGRVAGHPAEQALFRHLNHSKRISADTLENRQRLAADDTFDVMIFSDKTAADSALAAFPGRLIAAVTDFADEGPYRNWSGTEMIHQALSGSMYYNGRAGDTPLFGAGDRASYAAGLCLYIRILSSLRACRNGLVDPGVLHITIHEAAAAMEQNFSTQWSYSSSVAQRGELTRPKGRVKCKDGWMVFFAMENRLKELFTAFQAVDLLDDDRFSSWQNFVRNLGEATQAFQERAAGLTQAQLLQAALEHKLVLSPVRNLRDLYDDTQLAHGDFWKFAESEGEVRPLLGPMWRPANYSPGPVEHHPESSLDRRPSRRWTFLRTPPAAGAPTRPLHGIRVADFTTAWSGPLATRILAVLGATVIKVESRSHMDAWRGPATSATHPESYPDLQPGERPYNRNAWFNSQNVDKMSVTIDLKGPNGREAALALAGSCDIVLANFSPGTMNRLGLGFEQLKKAQPQIVMIEMSGYGNSGPLREHRGYGQTMEAMSGITSMIGYAEDREPLGSGSAYLDPMGGLAGAAAALTALAMRDVTASPQYAEVPQREAAMHWIGELILKCLETGTAPGPKGNDSDAAFPHDAFPCAGNDEWMALSVQTEFQWRALCGHFGWDDWRQDISLATLAGRRRRGEEILHRLRTRISEESKHTLAAALQGAGVPAAPVQTGRDLYLDPQLRHRNWFTSLSHPEAGTHDYPGLPFSTSNALFQPLGSAPTLGQHTDQVLSSLQRKADGPIPQEPATDVLRQSATKM